MPALFSQASKRRRRVMWLGLRTLRRLPRVVGETDEGAPVVEVDGTRLVLPGASHHFRRLDPCSRCGKEMVGSPIVTRHHLQRSGQPVVCRGCVASAGLVGMPPGSDGTRFGRESRAGAGEDAEGRSELDFPADDH